MIAMQVEELVMDKKRKTMTIKIHNIDQSQPMIFSGIDNTYIKEGFYCLVNRDANRVQKYPISRIFRIDEPYDPNLE